MGVSGLFILGLAIANRALATDDALVNQGRWSRLEPLPWSSTSCLLRVTLSCGKEEQAESRYGDLLSFPQQDGFVQVEHEMKLETGIATHGTPALRALQFESDTPTPSPSPIDPSTPGPQSFSDSVTLTTQPVLPPTNAPVAVMTPQPVTPTPAPRTVAPMVAATPAPTIAPALLPPTNTPVMIVPPTMTPTAPPVKAPTASPVIAPTASPVIAPTASPVIAPTASPVTPQTLPPTVENTPSPSKAPTPEPSLALVSPTGSPVTLAPVPSTEAPALTAVPTPEPTFSPSGMQTNPVAPPSTAPVPQPTTSPLASLSPQTPTILPTLAPNVIPTNLPSIAPDDTTRPSSAAQPSSSPAGTSHFSTSSGSVAVTPSPQPTITPELSVTMEPPSMAPSTIFSTTPSPFILSTTSLTSTPTASQTEPNLPLEATIATQVPVGITPPPLSVPPTPPPTVYHTVESPVETASPIESASSPQPTRSPPSPAMAPVGLGASSAGTSSPTTTSPPSARPLTPLLSAAASTDSSSTRNSIVFPSSSPSSSPTLRFSSASSSLPPSASPTAAETPTASVMPSVVPTTPGTTVPPLSTSKLPTPAPGGTGTPSPTASPDEATPAPAPEAPPTPRPVVLVVPTPSPVSSIGQCDSDCGNIILESSDYGAYYDEGCENSDANGCNLDASGDQFDNCRRCVIDPETYDGDANYWECPCCVSESCPSTSSAGEDLDFRDLETDPWMLVMEFSQTTCEATGILVEDNDESILDITKFVGAGGECGSDYESNTFYGELCEADGLNYSASIGSSSYTYQWDDICAESDLGRRRLLEFGSASYESMEILCNDDSKFVALFDITDGDYGMIYAQSSAQGYDALVAGQGEPSEEMCDDDANAVMERLMTSNLEDLIGTGDTSSSDDNGNDFDWIIIISVVAGMVILLGCVCCILCRRRGKVDRADQMRRNLGYTPDMEAKGEGNFGPTSTHVAITRGGGPKPTAEMLATKAYQGSYPVHNRAPSEAPSSIIENNISNNYRPRQAQQVWEERRVRKELTKPPTHQNVVTGATRGSASEELKTENVTQSARSSDAPRSEQLSEASLSKLEQERSSSQVLQAEGQPPFQYAYDGEVVPEEDDDDARSAMTGMSGPSKYAPSGYAPSSHHGVTHDQLSHYEPSVYEADSTYDASIYGRESEFDDGSTYHSHDARSSHRGSGYAVRGRGGYHATSTRGSVADTAAGSVLGSVLEMDDGDDAGRSAYAPSESYVSSYISSEDEGRVGRALSRNVQANGDNEPSPASGRTSRHSAHRSGRESVNGGRGFTPSTTRTMSSRHHSGRSGFDHESRGFDDDTYEGGHGSMEDVQYFDDDRHSQVPSSQGVPLTNADETSSSRPDW